MRRIVENLRLGDRAMRFSHFVPRLYNYCLSLGFERDRMMPSRAFCSDESQGYPVILMAQHFGTFPFDHGRVGGKVAINRHGPPSHHGEDLVIVQASHVGYDADTGRFGVYQRQRSAGREFGDSCGKLCAVLHWYQHEYQQARDHVLCGSVEGVPAVFIDNQFLDERRHEGLFLNMDRLVDRSEEPFKILSTSKAFPAAPLSWAASQRRQEATRRLGATSHNRSDPGRRRNCFISAAPRPKGSKVTISLRPHWVRRCRRW